MSKFKWRKSYWWLVVLAMILLFGCWVYPLNRGTYSYLQKESYVYSYLATQTPNKPVSGRPITFEIQIKEDGHPFANRKVTASVSHAYGVGVKDRVSDRFEKELTTDSSGKVIFEYTPKFQDVLADKGFGFSVTPILTEKEKADFSRKLVSAEIDPNTNIAPSYNIPVIYPRWLSWLIWW